MTTCPHNHRDGRCLDCLRAELERRRVLISRLDSQLTECYEVLAEIIKHTYGTETTGLRTICTAILRRHGQLK